MKDEAGQRKHAVDFFNFMLKKCFPDLVEKYTLAEVEPSEERNRQYPAKVRPTSLPAPSANLLVPAVMSPNGQSARLLPVSETVDCQTGGLIVRTNSAPTG
ncbi:MAG TPA: hypothetical protein VGR76_04440 [Candidatus Angelobacter sp.]|nr:hypothetical protein [Candidatus Angelobacter sp.]